MIKVRPQLKRLNTRALNVLRPRKIWIILKGWVPAEIVLYWWLLSSILRPRFFTLYSTKVKRYVYFTQKRRKRECISKILQTCRPVNFRNLQFYNCFPCGKFECWKPYHMKNQFHLPQVWKWSRILILNILLAKHLLSLRNWMIGKAQHQTSLGRNEAWESCPESLRACGGIKGGSPGAIKGERLWGIKGVRSRANKGELPGRAARSHLRE